MGLSHLGKHNLVNLLLDYHGDFLDRRWQKLGSICLDYKFKHHLAETMKPSVSINIHVLILRWKRLTRLFPNNHSTSTLN
ncbi:hypothetical protein YC2023_034826 [Brassica napus]